jgi:hypothetical protein
MEALQYVRNTYKKWRPCFNIFISPSYLSEHRLTHALDTSLACDKCPYTAKAVLCLRISRIRIRHSRILVER